MTRRASSHLVVLKLDEQRFAKGFRLDIEYLANALEGEQQRRIARADPLSCTRRLARTLSGRRRRRIAVEALDRLLEHREHECTRSSQVFSDPGVELLGKERDRLEDGRRIEARARTIRSEQEYGSGHGLDGPLGEGGLAPGMAPMTEVSASIHSSSLSRLNPSTPFALRLRRDHNHAFAIWWPRKIDLWSRKRKTSTGITARYSACPSQRGRAGSRGRPMFVVGNARTSAAGDASARSGGGTLPP